MTQLLDVFIRTRLIDILFFFWFLTVFPQRFQPETNYCSCRVSPRRGKALTKEIIFKVQVAELELGSTPSRAKYKHFETKSSTNLANLLGLLIDILFETIIIIF